MANCIRGLWGDTPDGRRSSRGEDRGLGICPRARTYASDGLDGRGATGSEMKILSRHWTDGKALHSLHSVDLETIEFRHPISNSKDPNDGTSKVIVCQIGRVKYRCALPVAFIGPE